MYADATVYVFPNTFFSRESLGPKYGKTKKGILTVNYVTLPYFLK